MSSTKSPASDAGNDGADADIDDVGYATDPSSTESATDGVESDDGVESNDGVESAADAPGDVGADSAAAAVKPDLRRTVVAALIVLVIDQATKIWAVSELTDRNIDLIGSLRLNLIRNTGASFGLGTGLGRWLALVVLVIVGVVIAYARTVTDRRIQLLLGAIAGGAIGNFVDRVFRADDGPLSGGVIDFIDLQWWPIFNAADSAVVCGAIGIVILSMREPA